MRRLRVDDLAHYKALRDAMLAAHPQAFTTDAAAAARQTAQSYHARLGIDQPGGGHFTLSAWRDAELVGAVSCERESRGKARHIGQLVGMMVADPGRGIGQALLDACIAEARRAEGLEMLTLSVTAGNWPAEHLYRRAGFTRYGSLPRAIKLDGRYHDKHLMVLTL